MKVNIGPYRSDVVPIRRWERRYEHFRSDNYYHDEEDYEWYDKIVYKIFDGLAWVFLPLNRWSNSRKRKVDIRIDNYDIWSADHTLALIIAPVLRKLRDERHGIPMVDDEDVPEELRGPLSMGPWSEEDDERGNARWAYVIGEMIWAFEQHTDDYDGENQFHHNSEQLKMEFTPLEDNPKLSEVSFNHQKDPDKPAYWRDDEGLKAHRERKANGVRLFAKYYEALWD